MSFPFFQRIYFLDLCNSKSLREFISWFARSLLKYAPAEDYLEDKSLLRSNIFAVCEEIFSLVDEFVLCYDYGYFLVDFSDFYDFVVRDLKDFILEELEVLLAKNK